MKKRILIPTDFSRNAYNALKYATELYKREFCEFTILHTHYHSGFSKENLLIPEPSEKAFKAVKENAEKEMEKIKAQIKLLEKNNNHDFHFKNEFGPFYEILEKTVEEEDITLVIMGTRGETDDSSVLLGSNAVNAMEEIRNCPVLAIPAKTVYKDPNEIVFPTSFKTHYKEKELLTLIEISRITNAPIRILHVQKGKKLTEAQEENKALLERILDVADFTHHILYDIELQQGVRCFVQSRGSDMIAFVNKKHNFFSSIFSNPMVKELGKHTTVPILAMHDLRN